MHVFAVTRRAILVAAALASSLFGATSAFADGVRATATFDPPTIVGDGTSSVTIRLVNETGENLSGTLETTALPPLPDGLEYVTGPDQDGCVLAPDMPDGSYCEMTAVVRGLAVGTYDWFGDGDTGHYALSLASASQLLVVGPPAWINATGGVFQDIGVNAAFAEPLAVTVTDESGNPVPGIEVTFTAPTSDPTATLSNTTAVTDENGQASVTATAGPYAGSYTVQASVTGVDTPAEFYLNNIPPPSEMRGTVSYSPVSIAPGGQSAVVIQIRNTSGRMLNRRITTDDLPALPSGMTMVGQPDLGSCDVQFGPVPNQATCNMYATVSATTAGKHYWSGSGAANTSANIYITLTDAAGLGVYGTPTAVTAKDGDGQSVPVDGAFETLWVEVTDENGVVVPNVEVTFTASSSGAGVADFTGTVSTNADGRAGVDLTANGTAGSFTIEASIDGGTPATFSLTNLPGDPSSVQISSGNNQSATVETTFSAPLVVRVVDTFGNPLSGQLVTFTAPADGASGSFAGDENTATSDQDGYATSAVFTANAIDGAYSVSAAVAGVTPASFSLTNTLALVDPPALPAVDAMSPDSGPAQGGTSVTISGSNLTGATAVTFGGTEADFEVVDDTIIAVSPAGSGVVDVLVSTPEGTSTPTGASQFTYDTPGPDHTADSAAVDSVQQTFAPIISQQSARSMAGSIASGIQLGMSGGSRGTITASDVFLAYGPTVTEPATPFDDILADPGNPLPENISVWLDTSGQGILPISTTPQRGWQVNITGGVGVRVTPDLLIGGIAGAETFSYRSEDSGATLSGSGTSLGAYAGWNIGGRLLVTLGVVNTALDYKAVSGAAVGNFQASRWLVTGEVSGEYSLGDFSVQPSASLLAIWESQDGYIDSVMGEHDAQDFGSAVASGGIRISRALPISEDWQLTPYVGAYFEADAESAVEAGDATYGVSGRLTAGAAITSDSGLYLGLDTGISGFGTDTLTLSARGNLRSSF